MTASQAFSNRNVIDFYQSLQSEAKQALSQGLDSFKVVDLSASEPEIILSDSSRPDTATKVTRLLGTNGKQDNPSLSNDQVINLPPVDSKHQNHDLD